LIQLPFFSIGNVLICLGDFLLHKSIHLKKIQKG